MPVLRGELVVGELVVGELVTLPKVGAEDDAWALYVRTWRPGAYARGTPAQRADLRAKWSRNYAPAVDEVVR